MVPHTHTDILQVQNLPFVTLVESKVHNIWYHENMDQLFILTPAGFAIIKNSSKKNLQDRKLL